MTDEYFHREHVLGISWFIDDHVSNLATISSDGKILLWTNVDKQNLGVEEKDLMYPIKGSIFTQIDSRTNIVGATSIAMVQDKKKGLNFIVGTENGVVQKCFFEITRDLPDESYFKAQW